jgi:hypothetical protein
MELHCSHAVLRRTIKKEAIMTPINIEVVEREARQLRAQELQRIEGIFVERMALYGRLLVGSAGAGLAVIADALRPLFSWNPQARRSH